MMPQVNPDRVIELLTRVYERPSLYMRDLSGIDEFLDGVRISCLFLGGLARDVEIYQEILQEQGWDPYLGLSQKELSNAQNERSDLEIAQELLKVEIETWKRMSRTMLPASKRS